MYTTAYNYCMTLVKKNSCDLRDILYCYFEKRNSKKTKFITLQTLQNNNKTNILYHKIKQNKFITLQTLQNNKTNILYHKIKQNKFITFQNSNKTNNFSSCDYSHWDLIMRRHMPLLWSMLSRFR